MKEENYGLVIQLRDVFPETVNDTNCAKNVQQIAQEQGMQLVELEEAFWGSEDLWYCRITSHELLPM